MSKKVQMTLFFLSFLGDFGNSLLLVTSVAYGVTLTEDPLIVGMIGAAYGLTYLITPAILGKIGDKFPRKTSLLIASSGQALIAVFFFIFAKSPVLLIVGQIMLGIAYGFYWPSIEAYTSETTHIYASFTPEQAHKKGILAFCIAWSIGYMIGPLLAGVFGQYFLAGAFITVIVTYCFEFILIVVILPKIQVSTSNPVVTEENDYEKSATGNSGSRVFLFELIMTVLLYAGISKAMYTYFTDYALDSAGLSWTNFTIGWVLFCFGLGRTLYFIVNYIYIHIRSSMKLNLFAFLGMGLCVLIIPFFTHPVSISIIMVFTGVSAGMVYSSTLDLMLHQEKQAKGAKAGLFESMVGVGSIVTPFAAGAIAKISQLTVPFYVLASVTLVVFFILFVIEFRPFKK